MKKYISEMIFTFIFVLVVLGVTDDKKGTPVMCGLAIGLTAHITPSHASISSFAFSKMRATPLVRR